MGRLGHRFFNEHSAAAQCVRDAAKGTYGFSWDINDILYRIEHRASTLIRAMNLAHLPVNEAAKETNPNAFWRFFSRESEQETWLKQTLHDSAERFYENLQADLRELYRLSPETTETLLEGMEQRARAHLMAGNAVTGILGQAVILPVAFGIAFDRLLGAGNFGLGCAVGLMPFCLLGLSNALFIDAKKIPIEAEGVEDKLGHGDTPPAFRAYYALLKPFSPLSHTLLVAFSPTYRGIRHALHDAHDAAHDAEKEARQRELAATPPLKAEEMESQIRDIWRSGGGSRRF